MHIRSFHRLLALLQFIRALRGDGQHEAKSRDATNTGYIQYNDQRRIRNFVIDAGTASGRTRVRSPVDKQLPFRLVDLSGVGSRGINGSADRWTSIVTYLRFEVRQMPLVPDGRQSKRDHHNDRDGCSGAARDR